jgi:hypothetical protein
MVERVLGGERCGQRVRCGGERGMDRTSNRFEHDPAARGDDLLEHGVMPSERWGHRLCMRFPHGRAANDVGKQEGEGALWEGWQRHVNQGRTRSARVRRRNRRMRSRRRRCRRQRRRSVVEPVEGEILRLAKIHSMERAMGRAIGFPIPAAAGLPLLAGGEAPGWAGKCERRRVLQPGKPCRRVHGNRAGIVCRENQPGAIHQCGRARHSSAFRYALC